MNLSCRLATVPTPSADAAALDAAALRMATVNDATAGTLARTMRGAGVNYSLLRNASQLTQALWAAHEVPREQHAAHAGLLQAVLDVYAKVRAMRGTIAEEDTALCCRMLQEVGDWWAPASDAEWANALVVLGDAVTAVEGSSLLAGGALRAAQALPGALYAVRECMPLLSIKERLIGLHKSGTTCDQSAFCALAALGAVLREGQSFCADEREAIAPSVAAGLAWGSQNPATREEKVLALDAAVAVMRSSDALSPALEAFLVQAAICMARQTGEINTSALFEGRHQRLALLGREDLDWLLDQALVSRPMNAAMVRELARALRGALPGMLSAAEECGWVRKVVEAIAGARGEVEIPLHLMDTLLARWPRALVHMPETRSQLLLALERAYASGYDYAREWSGAHFKLGDCDPDRAAMLALCSVARLAAEDGDHAVRSRIWAFAKPEWEGRVAHVVEVRVPAVVETQGASLSQCGRWAAVLASRGGGRFDMLVLNVAVEPRNASRASPRELVRAEVRSALPTPRARTWWSNTSRFVACSTWDGSATNGGASELMVWDTIASPPVRVLAMSGILFATTLGRGNFSGDDSRFVAIVDGEVRMWDVRCDRSGGAAQFSLANCQPGLSVGPHDGKPASVVLSRGGNKLVAAIVSGIAASTLVELALNQSCGRPHDEWKEISRRNLDHRNVVLIEYGLKDTRIVAAGRRCIWALRSGAVLEDPLRASIPNAAWLGRASCDGEHLLVGLGRQGFGLVSTADGTISVVDPRTQIGSLVLEKVGSQWRGVSVEKTDEWRVRVSVWV